MDGCGRGWERKGKLRERASGVDANVPNTTGKRIKRRRSGQGKRCTAFPFIPRSLFLESGRAPRQERRPGGSLLTLPPSPSPEAFLSLATFGAVSMFLALSSFGENHGPYFSFLIRAAFTFPPAFPPRAGSLLFEPPLHTECGAPGKLRFSFSFSAFYQSVSVAVASAAFAPSSLRLFRRRVHLWPVTLSAYSPPPFSS